MGPTYASIRTRVTLLRIFNRQASSLALYCEMRRVMRSVPAFIVLAGFGTTACAEPAENKISTFKPISYKCQDRDNTIEFVKKNKLGTRVKYTAYLRGNEIYKLIIWVSLYSEEYRLSHQGFPQPNATDEYNKALSKAEREAYEVKSRLCDRSDYSFRSRYEEILAGNRRALENVSP